MLKAAKATPGTRASINLNLDRLLEAIRTEGYTVYGPTLATPDGESGSDPIGAAAFREVRSVSDLAVGVRSEWSAGRARVHADAGGLVFSLLLSPSSAKGLLFPPRQNLWSGRLEGQRLDIEPPTAVRETRRIAILGLRACDLAAVLILDRVLVEGPYPDPAYRAARERSLLIAVDCRQPHETCFCTSVGGKPYPSDGFDLRVTELGDGADRRFLIEAGSPKGEAVLVRAFESQPKGQDLVDRDAQNLAAEAAVTRRFSADGLKEAMYASAESPVWNDIAERCLACGNCTMVCPTCFCTTVTDTSSLDGTVARDRVWDSCFNADFSYIHGGSVRQSTASRYRQWITHKLAAWQDQFGTIGCVGCGRCVAWCPAGIDIAAEACRIQRAHHRPDRPDPADNSNHPPPETQEP